jgi:hypothetical protein
MRWGPGAIRCQSFVFVENYLTTLYSLGVDRNLEWMGPEPDDAGPWQRKAHIGISKNAKNPIARA